MTNSTITGTITDPLATPLQYIKVTARLYPRPAYVTATGVELTLSTSTLTDASGVYSFALRNTADITPADSYYVITEFIPDKYGGPVKHIIQAAGDNTVYASLVSPVPAPDQNVYLTQAAGDARYVQSPGSFGASGSISSIEPDDAVSAGVASTYARSDHQHAIVAATPGSILPDDAAAEGAATSFARSDHTHAITAAAPATLVLATANDEGAASSFARSDHVHRTDNYPLGIMGKVEISTNTAALATNTDLGLSVTITGVAGRYYKVTYHIYGGIQVGAGDSELYIVNASNTKLAGAVVCRSAVTTAYGFHGTLVIAPGAGSYTFKLRNVTTATSMTYYALSTAPALLLVEDIGKV